MSPSYHCVSANVSHCTGYVKTMNSMHMGAKDDKRFDAIIEIELKRRFNFGVWCVFHVVLHVGTFGYVSRLWCVDCAVE